MYRFILTSEHLRLLKNVCISTESGEAGDVPCIDSKRPFGNGSWEYDVADILEWDIPKNEDGEIELTEHEYEVCRNLLIELKTALQIVLNTCSFHPGEYESEWGYDWESVKT